MYNTIYNLVENNPHKTFEITYSNGKKQNKRLFISNRNEICEFKPKSRRFGYKISIDDIIDINLKREVTPIEMCRKNLLKVQKYLSQSGFWQPMARGAIFLQTLTDEELLSMRKWDTYYNVMNEERTIQGIQWFGIDCFINLFNLPIKTMNFHSYEREEQIQKIRDSICYRKDCSDRWTKGYDNSFEIRFNGEYIRAWYSEEYRGCLNGHYYFLLDEKHVLFGEDD